jgi:hypothetical protein
MNISEDELRALVRDIVARQKVEPSSPGAVPAAIPAATAATPSRSSRVHASHGLILAGGGGGDDEGRCLIEPAVACTHCGYCQSLGH